MNCHQQKEVSSPLKEVGSDTPSSAEKTATGSEDRPKQRRRAIRSARSGGSGMRAIGLIATKGFADRTPSIVCNAWGVYAFVGRWQSHVHTGRVQNHSTFCR